MIEICSLMGFLFEFECFMFIHFEAKNECIWPMDFSEVFLILFLYLHQALFILPQKHAFLIELEIFKRSQNLKNAANQID